MNVLPVMMLPPPVIQLLTESFPDLPVGDVQPTVGGYSNLSVQLTISGQRCVVKAAASPVKRADVRRDAHMLTLLYGRGLPAPELLALLENEAWTVAVTKFMPGDHGLYVLEQTPIARDRVYYALGQLLANVHATPLIADDPSLRIADRVQQVRALLSMFDLDAELGSVVIASLEHPVWQMQPEHLVHGDAGLHNILWDGQITALLDWEWAGWGNGALDLAWLHWTIRWRNFPEYLWETVLAGYNVGPVRMRTVAPETLQALVIGQIAQILIRAREHPDTWEEWVRRLRWTCRLAFPAL
jgi:aminoglycoside phosphotransferase (APT) family kinase protein